MTESVDRPVRPDVVMRGILDEACIKIMDMANRNVRYTDYLEKKIERLEEENRRLKVMLAVYEKNPTMSDMVRVTVNAMDELYRKAEANRADV